MQIMVKIKGHIGKMKITEPIICFSYHALNKIFTWIFCLKPNLIDLLSCCTPLGLNGRNLRCFCGITCVLWSVLLCIQDVN